MRQYKIWNKINSCLYKNSNKSYGVNDHSTKFMNTVSKKDKTLDITVNTLQ